MTAARSYNQLHLARPHTPGRRRISIYWSWSYPWEAQRSPALMSDRFSTMTEVRRVAWPVYETPEWGDHEFLQGIDGVLELFHRSTLAFQRLAEETTGHPVPVFQRVDQAGFRLPVDEGILADCDTLMIFGLDHLPAGEAPSAAEIEAIHNWLQREGTCLIVGPHHDVGFTDDPAEQQMEYLHHRDPLVPRRQRFSGYARGLMEGLGIPVENRWGLRPATIPGTTELAPITAFHDRDALGLLEGVTTLNFHPHLPHYIIEPGAESRVRLLARQPFDQERPHPFGQATGETEFNCLLWMPPEGQRAGDIVLVDLTHFTTLFGETESLIRFWRNIAALPAQRRAVSAA